MMKMRQENNMSNDIGIQATSSVPGVSKSKKPPHLLILTNNKKGFEYFISIDKPEFVNGMLQVKGIYSERDEDFLVSSYSEVLSQGTVLEMAFPLHRIHSIRNLVFQQK